MLHAADADIAMVCQLINSSWRPLAFNRIALRGAVPEYPSFKQNFLHGALRAQLCS